MVQGERDADSRETGRCCSQHLSIVVQSAIFSGLLHLFLIALQNQSGSDAVSWMVDQDYVRSRDDAVILGNLCMKKGFFYHVTRDHAFKVSR